MQFSDFRLEALNLMWLHCWYGSIKVCTSKPLSEDQKVWLKTFIGCGVGQLSVLLERYSEVAFTIYIYIGDLYRYSYANCNKTDLDFRFAKHFYLKSAQFSKLTNGRPFNQLALLCQEAGDMWLCLNYFIKALIVEEPFRRATDNIKRLDEFDFKKNDGQQIIFNLIRSFIGNFRLAYFTFFYFFLLISL